MIIHYFASVREALGVDKEEISGTFATVQNLVEHLGQRDNIWKQELTSEQTLVAVNQQMATRETKLEENSEVAFFPYMTGG